MSAHPCARSTPRKPQKKPNAEKSKRSSGIRILILYDNGSAVNVEGGAAEVTGEVVISIEAPHGVLDLHLHDVGARFLAPIIVALHPGVTSIPTSQAIAVAVNWVATVVGLLRSEDLFHDLHLVR